METTARYTGDGITLEVKGRLDSYWSEHFANELERLIQSGSYKLTLDFEHVEFLSSAGIAVIMRYFNVLKGMQGYLKIVQPQKMVRSVLKMTGLEKFLVDENHAPVPQDDSREHASFRSIVVNEKPFSVNTIDENACMSIRFFGEPEGLRSGTFLEANTYPLTIAKNSISLGVGAFGETYDECKGRFGEYLAIGGCATYMPTDDTNMPDYLLAKGSYLPTVLSLYGIQCEGAYSHLFRFDSQQAEDGYLLSDLIQAGLDTHESDCLAFAVIAETTGLVGASLKHSPAKLQQDSGMFAHPEIQKWISFTAEPAYPRSLALIAGVVSRNDNVSFKSLLRPLSNLDSSLYGHFHAMPCNSKPLASGVLDIAETIANLLQESPPLDVLHLLNDTRRISGVGESEFTRGAFWVAPIRSVIT
jgi:anti-anti-sigma factor